MILIKDRHLLLPFWAFHERFIGNYDTYKGSTPNPLINDIAYIIIGNYDTYKGSTLEHLPLCLYSNYGNYDTYKGSTHGNVGKMFG